MEDNKKRLGKGLLELLGDEVKRRQALKEAETSGSEVEHNQIADYSEVVSETSLPLEASPAHQGYHIKFVPIYNVIPNPEQPRKSFDEDSLKELSESIQQNGILQPILVTKPQSGVYKIIAGERRWRAAQLAHLHEIPILIKEMDETDILTVALIENIQRSNLNPIEEAKAFRALSEHKQYTQMEIAHKIGKSRSYIANSVRLLELSPDIQKYLQDGLLSAGHGRILLMSDAPDKLAVSAVKEGWSVRDLENALKSNTKNGDSKKETHLLITEKTQDTLALEADLSSALGIKVSIQAEGGEENGRGRLVLSYTSLEQLDEICRRLCQVSAQEAS